MEDVALKQKVKRRVKTIVKEAVVALNNRPVLFPFWNKKCSQYSSDLWLADDLTSCEFQNTGKSWFNIEKKSNEEQITFDLNNCTFVKPEEKIRKKTKTTFSKKPEIFKTLKIRIFPTDEEKKKIELLCEQQRWFKNFTIDVIDRLTQEEKKNLNFGTLRKYMRSFEYTETLSTEDNIEYLTIDVQRTNQDKFTTVPWWNKVSERLIRGAILKVAMSYNSCVTKIKNGDLKRFKLSYYLKKDKVENCYFEDKCFPSFIRNIKSNYWYRTKDRKRKAISLSDIFEEQKRSLELVHDLIENKYFINYPVDANWFPKDDLRSDNQGKYTFKNQRVTALDQGVRKFLVGYDPQGKITIFGKGASLVLTKKLLELDKCEDCKESLLKWRQVKNYVSELHWKCIDFLIENYDVILLPKFEVSNMVRGKKLRRITKRLLYIFSFYKFRERLSYKCKVYKKKLIIVDESYTSKTCTQCGNLNSALGSSETYKCPKCKIKIDRDINGSRNIFLKNLKNYAGI